MGGSCRAGFGLRSVACAERGRETLRGPSGVPQLPTGRPVGRHCQLAESLSAIAASGLIPNNVSDFAIAPVGYRDKLRSLEIAMCVWPWELSKMKPQL